MKPRVLITGGNGFIGSHLGDRLTERGFTVVLLDRKFTENTAMSQCEKILSDIFKVPSCLESIVSNVDIIVHLAAMSRVEWGEQDPIGCAQTNILGTLNLLNCVTSQPQPPVLIFGSSREVYGEPDRIPVREEDPKNPISIYGVTKLAAENLIKVYARNRELRAIILRFSNVYGSERDLPQRVIPRFCTLAREGKPVTVNGGSQILDFTFIDDVVEAISNCVEKCLDNTSLLGTNTNLTSGEGISVRELAELIVHVWNSRSPIEILPARRFDVTRFQGDNFLARYRFSFHPRGLRRGLEIYKDRLADRNSEQKVS